MKTFVKCIVAIVVISAIVAGIILLGSINLTSVLKNPIEKQTNTDIDHPIIGLFQNSIAGGSIGNLLITAKLPNSPNTLTIYRGVFHEGDNINIISDSSKEGGDVTPEVDASKVAKKILEQYGGVPSDAIYQGATTHYANFVSRSTGEVTRRETSYTSVSWWRMLNGKRIVGDNDFIYLELGDNGDPLVIKKQWRNYTPSGNVAIIPVTKAISKLEMGEVISPPLLDNEENLNIYGITLGYYAKSIDSPEIVLEPVWIFYGNTSSDSYVSLEVYARQFANFTATPTTGKVPLTVTFTDTSDASPVKWLWNFGDGTNSTEHNPVHTFTTAGTYNVSLRAWNDLGSDTMVKMNYVVADLRNYSG